MNYLEDSGIDIACLQETWLSPADKSTYAIFKEYGYKFKKKERSENRGGGLAILYKPNLKLKRYFIQQSEKFVTFEYLCCTVTWDNKLIRLINIYRLPYSAKHRCTIKMFLNEFDLFISNLHTEKGVLLFCGDFNINWKDQENSSSEQFANILKTYDLLQLVDQETHIKGGLLNLMILDKELLQAATSVETDKSFQTDHYPVKLQLTSDWYLKKNEVIHQSVREFHKFNIELFHLDLQNELITDSEYVSTLSFGCDKIIQLYFE